MIATMAAPKYNVTPPSQGEIHRAKGSAQGPGSSPSSCMEDDLKRWLQRPKASPMVPTATSILRHAPPPPPPPRKNNYASDPTMAHASPTVHHQGPVMMMTRDVEQQSALGRRRGSKQGTVGSTSTTSRASKHKGGETLPSSSGPLLPGMGLEFPTSADSMVDMPLFDVVAFEELDGAEKEKIIQSYSKINSSDGSIFSLSSRTGRKHKKKNRKGSRSRSKNSLDGYGSDASKTSDLSKRSRRSQTSDTSKRSWMSNQTEGSYSSVFTNMNFKLKGFSISKDRKTNRKKHTDQPAAKFSSSEGDLLSDALGTRSVSGRKNPKYRNVSKHSTGSDTVTTATSTIKELSPLRSSPRRRVSFTQSDPSLQVLEEERPIKPPSRTFPHLGHTVTVATKGEPSTNTNSGKDDTTHVFDLPWVDNASGGKMHGLYSGPINDILQPHGDGTLVLEGNPFLKFYGKWVNGSLITPLRNEEEQKEHEKVANANREELQKEYMPKSSMEHHRKPPKQHSKKSSKESRKKSSGEYKKRRSKDLSVSTLGSSSMSIDPPGASDSPTGGAHHRSKSRHRRKPKYALGEVAHTPRDMVIHRDSEEGIESASLLKKYDQAFLKRSNGLWTCAVLADRALQPKTSSSSHWYTKHEIEKETMELEESMLFVINEDGATKIVKRRHWGRFVRCMQNLDGDKGGD